MVVWLAGILIGSALVGVGLLAYFPLPHEATEVASINATAQPPRQKRPSAASKAPPVPLPGDHTKSRDKSATATDKKVAGEAASQAAPPAAKPDEPLGIVDNPPKKMRPDDPKGIVADEPTGLLADAPRKPEPLGIPKEPKLGVVADTPKGLYEERTKPKTPEWLGERGGTIESQKAVEDGLNWLARHQGADGHWGADCLGTDPNSRCDQKAPCQGTGQAYEIAQTGLALLAFQAAGHYYFNGQKYSGQVAKGLDYFVQEQAPDGSIVGSQNPSAEQIKAGAKFQQYFMYEHALGTFALCEACAVAIAEGKKPDPRYLKAAERAVYFIQRLQHDDGGWRYTTNARDPSDCSVSGWVMLALKTAREAKLSVSPQTVSRMMDFFAAHYANGRTYYQPPNPGTDAMTGVGMMAVEFFQHTVDAPIVQGGADYLADQADGHGLFFLPNYYLWYNCTMAMFQVGGGPWKRWNSPVRDRVTGLQAQGEGCERGSWPPNDQWGGQGGRIYSTALAVLTLEVYYRFQRVAGQQENDKFFKK